MVPAAGLATTTRETGNCQGMFFAAKSRKKDSCDEQSVSSSVVFEDQLSSASSTSHEALARASETFCVQTVVQTRHFRPMIALPRSYMKPKLQTSYTLQALTQSCAILWPSTSLVNEWLAREVMSQRDVPTSVDSRTGCCVPPPAPPPPQKKKAFFVFFYFFIQATCPITPVTPCDGKVCVSNLPVEYL